MGTNPQTVDPAWHLNFPQLSETGCSNTMHPLHYCLSATERPYKCT